MMLGADTPASRRALAVIPSAALTAQQEGQPRRLDSYVVEGIMKRTRWTMAFVPPDVAARSSKVLVTVPYWQGQRVVGWQRS